MNRVNVINTYACEMCGQKLVTVDRDKGVTPMFMACRSCGGRSVSAWYRCDQSLIPTHEWYRLTPKQIKRQPKYTRDHFRKGGLDIREISHAE